MPYNYKGEIPGDWDDDAKRTLMSKYAVAVCFENMCEPNYFTEKFVEAVCAGCVPVYRAHASIAKSLLKGAFWIDPIHFENNSEATLMKAMEESSAAVAAANLVWLQSDSLKMTEYLAVFQEIAKILMNPSP